ncbi:MAG: hypothetical protein QOJ05_1634 [Verrucomicrobiota bacterium]
MPDQNEYFQELSAELERLRRALMELRRQPARAPEEKRPRDGDALESALRHLNSAKTLARLVQTGFAGAESQLDRAEREIWTLKVKRADATARLKSRERLLEQIQRSAAWKVVKPVWKLFNRSRRPDSITSDLAFALDLPQQWKTSR